MLLRDLTVGALYKSDEWSVNIKLEVSGVSWTKIYDITGGHTALEPSSTYVEQIKANAVVFFDSIVGALDESQDPKA